MTRWLGTDEELLEVRDAVHVMPGPPERVDEPTDHGDDATRHAQILQVAMERKNRLYPGGIAGQPWVTVELAKISMEAIGRHHESPQVRSLALDMLRVGRTRRVALVARMLELDLPVGIGLLLSVQLVDVAASGRVNDELCKTMLYDAKAVLAKASAILQGADATQ